MSNDYPKAMLVKALAETIFFAKKNYSNGHPTVSDESFDAMESELKKLCPAHPLISAVGDPGFEFLHACTMTSIKQYLGFKPTFDDSLEKPESQEMTKNGLICSVCQKDQFTTPSGPTCENGHGGEEGIPPIFGEEYNALDAL